MNNLRHPRISAIVAMDETRVIGKNNRLPWHLPADLKHFKAITTGHPILMGRKTYESIGRPLPSRTNIILTRDPSFKAPGCVVTTSIEEAIQAAAKTGSNEMFIIGGAKIYQQFMPHIHTIYLTLVHHSFAGDTFFPDLGSEAWKEIEREDHDADSENLYQYSFLKLARK